jgi:hypothetical protein
MNSYKKYLVMAGAIGLSSVALILAGVSPAEGDKPADVLVVNPVGSPVPVVTLPLRELHPQTLNATFSEEFHNFTFDPPAGKRLVVESASARVRLPPGQRAHATISANFSTGVGAQFLDLDFQGTFGGVDVYTTTQPVRLYVNEIGGFFGIVRTGTGSVFAEVSLAGYLEDAP